MTKFYMFKKNKKDRPINLDKIVWIDKNDANQAVLYFDTDRNAMAIDDKYNDVLALLITLGYMNA